MFEVRLISIRFVKLYSNFQPLNSLLQYAESLETETARILVSPCRFYELSIPGFIASSVFSCHCEEASADEAISCIYHRNRPPGLSLPCVCGNGHPVFLVLFHMIDIPLEVPQGHTRIRFLDAIIGKQRDLAAPSCYINHVQGDGKA